MAAAAVVGLEASAEVIEALAVIRAVPLLSRIRLLKKELLLAGKTGSYLSFGIEKGLEYWLKNTHTGQKTVKKIESIFKNGKTYKKPRQERAKTRAHYRYRKSIKKFNGATR